MRNETAYIKIEKSSCLSGTIAVDGAKNALLPIMIAAMLAKGISIIHHVPSISDLYSTINFLEKYNIIVYYDEKEKNLTIDTTNMASTIISNDHFKALRTSVLFASVALINFNEFWLGVPGGDQIGKRPVDIHLDGFRKFGIDITHHNEYVYLKKEGKLEGIEYFLPYPSVGATQNLLLLASRIEGKTILYNAAQEPEILDLIEVLEKMGVRVQLYFGGKIIIEGSAHLSPFEHTIMADRLEAATFLIASAITGGNIHIPNAPAYAMHSIINVLQKMGHHMEIGRHEVGITCYAGEKSQGCNLKTMPYPGLATDYQAPLLALLSVSEGESILHETVFENRMFHAFELNKMGASIFVESDYAKIKGVKNLYGNVVSANDIRATATLIIAGLVAEGETIVFGLKHLLRGYANFEKKLQSLGGAVHIYNEKKTEQAMTEDAIVQNIRILQTI